MWWFAWSHPAQEPSCPAAKLLLLKAALTAPRSSAVCFHMAMEARGGCWQRPASVSPANTHPSYSPVNSMDGSESRDIWIKAGRVCISEDIRVAKGQNKEIQAPETLRKAWASVSVRQSCTVWCGSHMRPFVFKLIQIKLSWKIQLSSHMRHVSSAQ